MVSAIEPRFEVPKLPELERPKKADRPTIDTGRDFSDRLKEFVSDVNETQKNAQFLASEYAQGRQNDLAGTMIAVQKADITLRLLSSIRNRALEAYREMKRMGV